MQNHHRRCSDCESGEAANKPIIQAANTLGRREFLAAGAAVALSAGLVPGRRLLADDQAKTPETLVKQLYESMTESQRSEVCFAWDYQHPEWGLLRTRVANNWQITKPVISGDYFNKNQQEMIRAIFEGIIHPDWHKRIDQQLEDDAGGYGHDQSLAIFGKPGDDKFEFVMTGRHMTIRCDGNSSEHVAFGGPIFYGHAANGFDEPADHAGNVFWHQALEANKVYSMLDGKQRDKALVLALPAENAVGFKGKGGQFPGIAVTDLSKDQKEVVQNVLKLLLEPYRQVDRDEVNSCLTTQGGIDACSLAFYKDGDVGNDSVWDCWRLEGPSFVWYFRGAPHVHVWVNVADDASIVTNA